MSRALWCVVNGRAAAPPARGCIIGVSTSTNSRSSSTRRMDETIALRRWNVRIVSGLANMSTYRWRYRSSASERPWYFSGGGTRLLQCTSNAVRPQADLAASSCGPMRAVDDDDVAVVQLLRRA